MKRTRTERRRQALGFTLIEVLLATAAFAIVLVAINAVFYGTLRLRNKATAALDESLPLRHAVTTLQHDLVNLVLPGGTISGSFQTVAITNSLAGQASPDFYTTGGVIDETSPWADVRKVSYALVSSDDKTVSGMNLVRAVTRNLLPAASYEQPVTEWLMGGVQSLTFSYFDGSQWRAWWDSTAADPVSGQTNTLPQAIKVQIHLAAQQTDRQVALLAPVELIAPVLVQARGSESTGGSQ
jgi:type II secretion system protein J